MKDYIEIFSSFKDENLALLEEHILFKGLSRDEISAFIYHSKPGYIEIFEGRTKRISKEEAQSICVVITGRVHVYGIDYAGNKMLHKTIDYSQTSGTLFSMLDYKNTLVEFDGELDSSVILLKPDSVFTTESSLAVIQHKIAVNMIQSQKEMFFSLSEHLYCLCQRSIRDKILKLLSNYSERSRSYEFDLPFSREDMANYLAVDRASLSRSLGELKSEGLIDFKKNHFKILTTEGFKY